MRPTIGYVPAGTKKKLTRQSVMKVDPNWLILLDESLKLVANQLENGGKAVEDPAKALRNIGRALRDHVAREYNI